jgi:hypothetical protein
MDLENAFCQIDNQAKSAIAAHGRPPSLVRIITGQIGTAMP